MAQKRTQGAPAALSSSFDAVTHLSIAWHCAKQVATTARALAAIEQLLDVPLPDSSQNDNGNMRRVWRDDLAELLGVVRQSLEDKNHDVQTNAKAALETLLGKPVQE